MGGDLKHYAQDNGSEPLIALGRVGTLTLTREQFDALALGLPWQRLGEAGIIRVL